MKDRTELKMFYQQKNLQFLSNQADILPKYFIRELVNLVEYQLDWQKIVNFLLIS